MPPSPLRLYSYDGNQFCRLVREVLCECDLPYELRSTGKAAHGVPSYARSAARRPRRFSSTPTLR